MLVDNTKTCTDCGLNKSFDCYSIQKRGRFGLSPTCKACASKRNKANRENNRNANTINVALIKFCPNCKVEKSSDLANLQWVTEKINRMKTDMTHEEFLKTCRLIYLLNKDDPCLQ